MVLRAVQSQEPTRVSVDEAAASVSARLSLQKRASRRSRRLSAVTLAALIACSIVTVSAAVAVTVSWLAGELAIGGAVVTAMTNARGLLWVCAGALAGAVVLTGLLEARASATASVAADAVRVLEGLAVEVVAVRAVLTTGVTAERRARAAGVLRHSAADGRDRHEAWTLAAARLIEDGRDFGRATVREPERAVAAT